jgi:hypothetical protein
LTNLIILAEVWIPGALTLFSNNTYLNTGSIIGKITKCFEMNKNESSIHQNL